MPGIENGAWRRYLLSVARWTLSLLIFQVLDGVVKESRPSLFNSCAECYTKTPVTKIYPDAVLYPCGLTANYVFSDRYLMEVFEDGKWRPVHVATDVRDIGWYSRQVEISVGVSRNGSA